MKEQILSRNRSLDMCRRTVTTDSFIKEAKQIFGDLYDYSKVQYINRHHMVTITCPVHGDFRVFAREHLDGKRCPMCDKTDKFIKKLTDRFGNRFGLDKLVYRDSTTRVTLICPEHGEFICMPQSILSSKYGCPMCAQKVKEASHKEVEARKTAIEKAGVIETQHDGDIFTVLSKNVKELEPLEVKKDYQSLFGSIKELSNDISSDNASFITNNRRSCQSNPKVLLNLPKSFVSIDFEKFYSQAISVCSVGLVKFINGEIVDRYYTLIRPPFEDPLLNGRSLEWINNITRNMLEEERPFNEILPEMEDFIGGLPLVAHNACIERDCIAKTAKYYGMSTCLPVNDIIDTYRLALDVEAALDLKVECRKHAHSLDTLCVRFNVPRLAHHNALDDAIMCGNLLLALSSSAEGKSIVQPVEETHIERPKIKPEDKQQRTDLEDIVDNPFKNKVVVLTGFSRDKSQTYGHKLHELGAIIKDSVTKKTNILITGYNAGPSKLAKAQELGVDIFPEDKFLTIIKSYE